MNENAMITSESNLNFVLDDSPTQFNTATTTDANTKSPKNWKSISRTLQHSFLQLCNKHITYRRTMEVLGVISISIDDKQFELVVKINNTLKRVQESSKIPKPLHHHQQQQQQLALQQKTIHHQAQQERQQQQPSQQKKSGNDLFPQTNHVDVDIEDSTTISTSKNLTNKNIKRNVICHNNNVEYVDNGSDNVSNNKNNENTLVDKSLSDKNEAVSSANATTTTSIHNTFNAGANDDIKINQSTEDDPTTELSRPPQQKMHQGRRVRSNHGRKQRNPLKLANVQNPIVNVVDGVEEDDDDDGRLEIVEGGGDDKSCENNQTGIKSSVSNSTNDDTSIDPKPNRNNKNVNVNNNNFENGDNDDAKNSNVLNINGTDENRGDMKGVISIDDKESADGGNDDDEDDDDKEEEEEDDEDGEDGNMFISMPNNDNDEEKLDDIEGVVVDGDVTTEEDEDSGHLVIFEGDEKSGSVTAMDELIAGQNFENGINGANDGSNGVQVGDNDDWLRGIYDAEDYEDDDEEEDGAVGNDDDDDVYPPKQKRFKKKKKTVVTASTTPITSTPATAGGKVNKDHTKICPTLRAMLSKTVTNTPTIPHNPSLLANKRKRTLMGVLGVDGSSGNVGGNNGKVGKKSNEDNSTSKKCYVVIEPEQQNNIGEDDVIASNGNVSNHSEIDGVDDDSGTVVSGDNEGDCVMRNVVLSDVIHIKEEKNDGAEYKKGMSENRQEMFRGASVLDSWQYNVEAKPSTQQQQQLNNFQTRQSNNNSNFSTTRQILPAPSAGILTNPILAILPSGSGLQQQQHQLQHQLQHQTQQQVANIPRLLQPTTLFTISDESGNSLNNCFSLQLTQLAKNVLNVSANTNQFSIMDSSSLQQQLKSIPINAPSSAQFSNNCTTARLIASKPLQKNESDFVVDAFADNLSNISALSLTPMNSSMHATIGGSNNSGNNFSTAKKVCRRRLNEDILSPAELAEYVGSCDESTSSTSIQRPYQCSDCQLTCSSLIEYFRHTLNEHNTFICHQCGKYFTTKSSLLRHRPIHTGLRRFACAICSKAFYRKDKCKAHIKKHLNTEGDNIVTINNNNCNISSVTANEVNESFIVLPSNIVDMK